MAASAKQVPGEMRWRHHGRCARISIWRGGSAASPRKRSPSRRNALPRRSSVPHPAYVIGLAKRLWGEPPRRATKDRPHQRQVPAFAVEFSAIGICPGGAVSGDLGYLGLTPRWVCGTVVGGCSFMIHVRLGAAPPRWSATHGSIKSARPPLPLSEVASEIITIEGLEPQRSLPA